MHNIVFSNNIANALNDFVQQNNYSTIVFVTDVNTYQYCLPIVKTKLYQSIEIALPEGDKNKNLSQLQQIWQQMLDKDIDRNCLVVNIGGGMVCDIGAFAAATYKRGVAYVNIPTTLMAMVDAAIGGKNGINFQNYKNQIGTIYQPAKIFIYSNFLKTLPQRQIVSGYAEMLKHSLLDTQDHWDKIRSLDPNIVNSEFIEILLQQSIQVKLKYIENDLDDKSTRQALNFGHTIGHALETFFLNKGIEILHGEAIAAGIICEIYLSNIIANFNIEKVFEIVEYISSYFPGQKIGYDDYSEIIQIIQKDKKNQNQQPTFTLLEDFGKVRLKQPVDKSRIIEALNFYYQVRN